MQNKEMVLPDLEMGLLSFQRWTSCGEENILKWVKVKFVCPGGCASPRQQDSNKITIPRVSAAVKRLGNRHVQRTNAANS